MPIYVEELVAGTQRVGCPASGKGDPGRKKTRKEERGKTQGLVVCTFSQFFFSFFFFLFFFVLEQVQRERVVRVFVIESGLPHHGLVEQCPTMAVAGAALAVEAA